MKKQDITPKVIKLAKKIANHWRMEIYEGCWFAVVSSKKDDWEGIDAKTYEKPLIYLAMNLNVGRYYGYADPFGGCGNVFSEDPHNYCLPNEWYPIPSILDCLEKLRGLLFYGGLWMCGDYVEARFKKTIINKDDKDVGKIIYISPRMHLKSPLVVLFSALLEALKEEK